MTSGRATCKPSDNRLISVEWKGAWKLLMQILTVKTMERTVPATVRTSQAALAGQPELVRKKMKPWADVFSANTCALKAGRRAALFFIVFI